VSCSKLPSRLYIILPSVVNFCSHPIWLCQRKSNRESKESNSLNNSQSSEQEQQRGHRILCAFTPTPAPAHIRIKLQRHLCAKPRSLPDTHAARRDGLSERQARETRKTGKERNRSRQFGKDSTGEWTSTSIRPSTPPSRTQGALVSNSRKKLPPTMVQLSLRRTSAAILTFLALCSSARAADSVICGCTPLPVHIVLR